MYTAYQNIIISDSLKFQQRGQKDKLKVTLHYFSFWVSILFFINLITRVIAAF